MGSGSSKAIGALMTTFGVVFLVAAIAATVTAYAWPSGDPSNDDGLRVAAGIMAALAFPLLLVGVGLLGFGVTARPAPAAVAEGAPGFAPSPRAPAPAWALPGAFAVVAIAMAAAFVLMGAGSEQLFGEPGASEAEPYVLAMDGEVRRAGTFGGSSESLDESASVLEFEVMDDTTNVVVKVTWESSEPGADRLSVVLEVYDGSSWQRMAAGTGAGEVVVEHAGASVVEPEWRVTVSPVEGRAVYRQPFFAEVMFW